MMKFNNKNVYISPSAVIGNNVKIGDNTSIYDNVIIKDNCVISNNCIIGEPLNSYYYDNNYINPKTIIGENSMIRSHAIIYCGCEFGEGFSTGHRINIREFTKIGKFCKVGTLDDFQGYSEIGDYCWFHSNVHIGQKSIIGNFVFVYPYVVFTNDPTPPSNYCKGPKVGNYSQIATMSVLLPGIEIGENCLIGAGSVVSRNIPDLKLALGNPAKIIKDITDIKDKETGEQYYPWQNHFDRGMPWEGMNYNDWLKNSSGK